ncbi:hypothetical protein Rhal01_01442 [Rubritalea halochordaticola]|uniref:Sulfotransferase family protein n=2 Tax=Rubritalea halochordaticola TaxID=714537 RepID=A0ABP9UY21_9BACT
MQFRGHDLPEMAAAALENALKLEPNDGSIRLELARCYFESGRLAEGEDMMNSLGGTSGADGEFLLEMGKVWMLGDNVTRAIECFGAVTPKEDEYQQAQLEAVLLLVRSGKTELARDLLEQRVGRAGKSAILAEAVVAESEGNHSRACELHDKLWRGSPDSQLHLESGYRYARLLANHGEMPKALSILRKCKLVERRLMKDKGLEQACRARREYDLALMNEVGPEWFKGRCSLDSAQSFLMTGHPRSGTSLLAKSLASRMGWGWVDESAVFDSLAREWVAKHPSATTPGGLSTLLGHFQGGRAIQEKYLQRQNAYLGGEGRKLLDKNPGLSTSYVSLHALLPDIAWIVALRDPRDIAMSCYFQRFGDTMLGWSSLTPGGTLEAVLHFFSIWARVREWLPTESYREIKYEEFVEGKHSVLDSIEIACGSQKLLSPAGGPQVNLTPSYQDIQKPIYQSAVSRWKTAGEVFAVEGGKWEELLGTFGY